MNKGKPKLSEKKHLSIVIVPHSSNRVKVLRFTSLYGKLFVALILVLALIAATGIYISGVVNENKGLRSNLSELSGVNAEQKKLISQESDAINQLKDKEDNFDKDVNAKLKEATDKFNQITDKYLSAQSAKASRSGDRNEQSFSDDLADLKNTLDSIDAMYEHMNVPQADLTAAQEKLDKYMENIPTLWPVSGGHITDYFGNRKDPITGGREFHEGLDIGIDYGTKIKAAASGKVILAERYGGYGKAIIIDHGNGLQTLYGHTSKLLVKEGQTVKKGDVIAESGSSGRSTGPHLHFQVILYDTPVDPLQYLDKK